MISNAEMLHVRVLKRWSQDMRAGYTEFENSPVFKLVKDKFPLSDPTSFFENVDWMVAIIEREYTAQRTKMLAGKK